MTDKKVILDYATELQTNDEPWREFEYSSLGGWFPCKRNTNPFTHSRDDCDVKFRRKPKTITVTMPMAITYPQGFNDVVLTFGTKADRDTALAAIRDAMGGC